MKSERERQGYEEPRSVYFKRMGKRLDGVCFVFCSMATWSKEKKKSVLRRNNVVPVGVIIPL